MDTDDWYVMNGIKAGRRTFGAQNPRNAPSRQPKPLSQAVNNQDIVFVHILDILGRRDGRSVAVAGVIVARVELVANEGGAAAANILDFGQLWIADDTAGRVAWVGGEDDGRAAGYFLGDLGRMDVVAVLLAKRDGDGGELEVRKGEAVSVTTQFPRRGEF